MDPAQAKMNSQGSCSFDSPPEWVRDGTTSGPATVHTKAAVFFAKTAQQTPRSPAVRPLLGVAWDRSLELRGQIPGLQVTSPETLSETALWSQWAKTPGTLPGVKCGETCGFELRCGGWEGSRQQVVPSTASRSQDTKS